MSIKLLRHELLGVVLCLMGTDSILPTLSKQISNQISNQISKQL